MVIFPNKRLQVFVSSTYKDLIEERQAAVEAILTAGHIPAGMELFTSGDESQMEVIKQWIDESDVFLLILGGRYGSIEPDSGKSYTQLEYEYAHDIDKLSFACAIEESELKIRAKDDSRNAIEIENPEKYEKFRSMVLAKTIKFWEDSKDIKIAIIQTLSTYSRQEDLLGWVRSNEKIKNMPELLEEIARLSSENATLRSQLETGNPLLINGLGFDELENLLTQKGVLDTLQKFRLELGSAYGTSMQKIPDEARKELIALGLITPSEKNRGYLLFTDAGTVFMNKLEIQRLKLQNETL